MAPAPLRPCAFATSAIEVEALDHRDDDPADDYQPIREAWRAGRLDPTVPGLRRALFDLSNACDEIGYGDDASPMERAFNRRASASLAKLACRVPA